MRWDCIKEMVLLEPEIFESDKRGRVIKAAVDKTGKNKRLFYKYLTQYWQRGKVKNALLPDYKESGGKGKEKTFTERRMGESECSKKS